MQDRSRSAVAVSDRYPGRKNCLRIVTQQLIELKVSQIFPLTEKTPWATIQSLTAINRLLTNTRKFFMRAKTNFLLFDLHKRSSYRKLRDSVLRCIGFHGGSSRSEFGSRRYTDPGRVCHADARDAAYRLRHGDHFLSDVTMTCLRRVVL